MRRRGVGRVGRPSLIGTAARTAVVAGTATAVVGGMSHHQQEKAQTQADAAAYQQQQQQAAMDAAAQQPAAQAPPASSGPDPVAQLKELAELKAQGVLTEEEFAAEKAKILAQ
jgi:membrane protease subunit (stomatin/prohibitin family)